MSAIDIILVAVHTLHLDRLAIEVVVTASQAEFIILGLSVANLNLTETNVSRSSLHNLALLVEQLHNKSITAGLLGTPFCGVLHGKLNIRSSCSAGKHLLYLFGSNSTANLGIVVAIKLVLVKLNLQRVVLCLFLAKVAHIHSNFGNSILVLSVEIGNYAKIANLHRICRCKRNRAENTGEAEHILRLQERSIAVTVNLNSHNVLTLNNVICNVESSQVTRVLRETNIAAVHPKIEERVHTVEIKINLAATPVCGHHKRTAVRTHLVTVLVSRMVGSRLTHNATLPVIHSNSVLENHRLVHIDGSTILLAAIGLQAIHVPVHRNLDLVPATYIVVGLVKIGRTLSGCGYPVKTPCAIERHVIITSLGKHLASALLVGKGKEPSLGLLFVQRQLSGRFPFVTGRRSTIAISKTSKVLPHSNRRQSKSGNKCRNNVFSHNVKKIKDKIQVFKRRALPQHRANCKTLLNYIFKTT